MLATSSVAPHETAPDATERRAMVDQQLVREPLVRRVMLRYEIVDRPEAREAQVWRANFRLSR